MADWYVSSAAYAGYTAFQTSHGYSIGAIIVPTAPAAKAKWVLRCTTAGTSTTEPTWNVGNNATSTSGTAVFTNITGQSSFFWTAAAGDLPTLGAGVARTVVGDRVFVSSDHAETQTATTGYGATSTTITESFGVIQYLCVNRAGSTPPVAADLTTGATCTVSTGNLTLDTRTNAYHYGITYVITSTGNIVFQNNANYLKSTYMKNCQLYLNNSTATSVITLGGGPCLILLDNTTVKFANAGHKIASNNSGITMDITWINTPSAIAGATIPTTLLALGGAGSPLFVTMRGVDLTALTGTLYDQAGLRCGGKILLDSCQIAPGLTRYNSTSVTNTRDEVELVNCYDGTNIISERYAANGTLTTETTITLTGGATDDVGTYSHKMVSNANIDKFAYPLAGFWMDLNYTTLASPRTATVEIVSSTTLQNDEIALYLEYEGTAGSSVASFGNSFLLTPLTPAGNVTASSVGWNSLPATPVKQKLQVTFTPQVAGRLRGQVRLGKASTTVYYNPQVTVT